MREKIRLVSTANTGYFYTTKKNRKSESGKGKLELMKFDPRARKHVLFKEKPMK